MINTTNWEKFKISEIFIVKKGKRLTKENQIPGDTVFIGATARNNGITGYIGQEPIHKGNTISISYNGSVGEAFYQENSYWPSDDVNVLYPKDFVLTKPIALFFCTILRHEKQMWSYARKWNLEKMNNTIIRLPATKDRKPDFKFIEKYISSFSANIDSIPDYFLNEGYEKACWYLDKINQDKFENEYANSFSKGKLALSEVGWKKFRLDSLFSVIKNGRSYNASELTVAVDDNYVSYVTRTDNNNGISMYVQALEYEGLEKANAITIGDTTATIFFQDHDFITGPHIIVLRAGWINVYTASFIIALLNQEKYRYPVFGRAFTKDLIMQTELLLPIDQNEDPNFEFMENYIKTLPYSVKISGD